MALQHPVLYVNSTGVCQDVIDGMTKWCDSWLPTALASQSPDLAYQSPDGSLRLSIGFNSIEPNDRDAIYIVQVLRAAIGNFQHCQMTMLSIDGFHATDEDVGVICAFLQDPTTPFSPPLGLDEFSAEHTRQLLGSLHNNKSVKELLLSPSQFDDVEAWMVALTELLRHKTDFTALSLKGEWEQYSFPIFSHLLSALRRGYPSLCKLTISSPDMDIDEVIDEDQVRWIIESLIEGNLHHHLEELDLSSNNFTSGALLSFCALSRFSRLKKLILNGNFSLLEQLENNRRFVRAMFPPGKESPVKELEFACCSYISANYIPFIKACEGLTVKLERLSIAHYDADEDNYQRICNQLVESVPKMKNLRHLTVSKSVFASLFHDDEDNRDANMTSFRKNTSLLEFSAPRDVPFLRYIAKRNNDLMRLQSLLRPAEAPPTSSVPVGTKQTSTAPLVVRIPWHRVLAKVGGNDPKGEGAYPVYKILRDRLPTWLDAQYGQEKVTNNKNKKPKQVHQSATLTKKGATTSVVEQQQQQLLQATTAAAKAEMDKKPIPL